ncbi:hypothetical protein J4439_04610 [Candidatus Woesearchaeota archaeon]|nr:hypothetical protein [Candidatus Woesearchaeota archaeon]
MALDMLAVLSLDEPAMLGLLRVLSLCYVVLMILAIFRYREIFFVWRRSKNKWGWIALFDLIVLFLFAFFLVNVLNIFDKVSVHPLVQINLVFIFGALFIYLFSMMNFLTLKEIGRTSEEQLAHARSRYQEEVLAENVEQHKESLDEELKRIHDAAAVPYKEDGKLAFERAMRVRKSARKKV